MNDFDLLPKSIRWPYVTIYEAIGGWQSVYVVWNEEIQMYEPWQTGNGPYGHTKEGRTQAENEARDWAKDECVECRIPGA